MKYDKATIVGVAFCVALLVLWGPLVRRLGYQPAPRVPLQPTEQQIVAPPAAEEGQVDSRDPESSPTNAPVVAEQTRAPTSSAPGPLTEAVAFPKPETAARLSVPDIVSVDVDPAGAGISAVYLHRYLTDDLEQDVCLGAYQYPLCALLLEETGWQTDVPVVVEQSDGHLVIERHVLSEQLTLREEWRLDPQKPYQVSYGLGLRNMGDKSLILKNLAVTCGGLPAAPPSTRATRNKRMAALNGGIDVMFSGAKRPKSFNVKNLKKIKGESLEALESTDVDWLALHSKYFLFYVSAGESAFSGCRVSLSPDPNTEDGGPWFTGVLRLPAVTVGPGQDINWTMSCYAGPKEYERLHALGNGLETILRMDLFLFWHPAWMGLITRQILRSLIGLNRFLGHRWGYGFAIVVITFVIKMLFWPLTHRSTASMRKMQKIQPLVKEVREKHKDQPEKMNRKIMELYREHHVSPLGGCLPMLLQIPVFFALFNTFRSAIELRHATFFWVADLSLPDTVATIVGLPIRPLALFMALSMLLQQKMMPTSGDPSQARMMSFMTVFFLFIFYSMPAGLTLYWTVNQVLTIIQNLVSRKLEKEDNA